MENNDVYYSIASSTYRFVVIGRVIEVVQMIVWPVSSNLGPILLRRGVHHILVTFVLCFINVTINNYIGGPFVTFLFGDWLHIPRPAVQPFPWNYLDAGLPQKLRIVLSAVYFGLLYGFGAVMHPEFFAP